SADTPRNPNYGCSTRAFTKFWTYAILSRRRYVRDRSRPRILRSHVPPRRFVSLRVCRTNAVRQAVRRLRPANVISSVKTGRSRCSDLQARPGRVTRVVRRTAEPQAKFGAAAKL